MKCPFLESEDCETCGYYDYVPEKKCYNCLHPFLNADDEKQQDWKKIVSYMRECGYEWSYEHMKHDYQTYWGKKGAGTFRRIFDVESFECLKHQSARTDKRVITTAAATTIGYR